MSDVLYKQGFNFLLPKESDVKQVRNVVAPDYLSLTMFCDTARQEKVTTASEIVRELFTSTASIPPATQVRSISLLLLEKSNDRRGSSTCKLSSSNFQN